MTLDQCVDVFVNAGGIVNIAEVGEVVTSLTRTTGKIEMQVGDRLVITRGPTYLKVELVAAPPTGSPENP
jgi:hypothetical protein